MKGLGGCFLVIVGIFGIFFSVVISFTFYFMPLAFVIFLGSLILISYAMGLTDPGKQRKNRHD